MLRPISATTAKLEILFSNNSQETALPARILTENVQPITQNCFHEITLQMDPLTHALASYSLKRAAFPRVTRSVTIAMLIAGTIADIDSLSKLAGPSAFPTFLAALAAAVLHLLMDLCQSTGVELFWPFSARRFALDWVAPLDLWILGILLAGILLPALSGLVTEEIGAKSKGPRGEVGA